jgi:hypothetical protein
VAKLWRCFPFDSAAAPGAAFSAECLVPGQNAGRFDLQDKPPVRYLASSSEHALAEILAPFRGQPFHPTHLRRSGHPLAFCEVITTPSLDARVADCNEPVVLHKLEILPGVLAHHDRQVTQQVARDVYQAGYAGLSWWSALTGAWRSTILFEDRIQVGELTYGAPRRIKTSDAEVATVRRFLVM